MPVRIRLQRKGRKQKPFYYVVAVDSRVKRDGKFIERLGSYDPTHHPALVKIDVEKAYTWLEKGAQPSNTARKILSTSGVMYKKHLQRGVKKGALTQEQADKSLQEWIDLKADNQSKIYQVEQQVQASRVAEQEAVEQKQLDERKAAIEEKQSEVKSEEQGADAAPLEDVKVEEDSNSEQ